MTQDLTRKGIRLMVLTALLWSTGGLLIKLLPWHPSVIAGARSGLACVVFAIYMGAAGMKPVFSRGTALVGVSMAVNFHCFVAANKLTAAANAVILQSTTPIFIIVLSALFFGTRFSRRELAAVSLCMGGITLFFLDSLTPGNLLGNALALLGGVLMGVMFVFSARAQSEAETTTGILCGHLFTALAGLPFWLWHPPELSAATVTAALAMGIFQMGIPYVLYGLAIRRCPPLHCSLLAMLEPLLNPLWVFWAVGERPGPLALAGGAAVIGTVCWWSFTAARAAGPEQPASRSSPDSGGES